MDEAVIRAMTKDFVEAYNGRDAAAATQVYADDAKDLPPNMPMVSGKGAIQAFWKFAMDIGARLNLETVELAVDGGMAYERGVITITMQPGTAQEKVTKGKYVTVMRR